jgi:hypothetical protein
MSLERYDELMSHFPMSYSVVCVNLWYGGSTIGVWDDGDGYGSAVGSDRLVKWH